MLLNLYPFRPQEMFSMPAWPDMIGAIVMALGEHGAHLLLAHSPDGTAIPPALIAGKVDGVIVIGKAPRLADELLDRLSLLPAVWAFREHNDDEHRFDHVFYDNHRVGALAADYLHERGHRRVAFFNVDPLHSAFMNRREVFCQKAADLGMQVDVFEAEAVIRPCHYLAYARSVVTQVAEAGAQRATALFGASDDQIAPIYNLLHCAGTTPFPLELIGCNNDRVYLSQMDPRPATIDIRLAEMGRLATEALFARIDDPSKTARSETLVKPVIVPARPG